MTEENLDSETKKGGSPLEPEATSKPEAFPGPLHLPECGPAESVQKETNVLWEPGQEGRLERGPRDEMVSEQPTLQVDEAADVVQDIRKRDNWWNAWVQVRSPSWDPAPTVGVLSFILLPACPLDSVAPG